MQNKNEVIGEGEAENNIDSYNEQNYLNYQLQRKDLQIPLMIINVNAADYPRLYIPTI